MDRMSATDAGFYYAESADTPMHVGSVCVFDGPAPTYGDLIRLLMTKLPRIPRYRQRVREVPLHLGRPLWVDDAHFQILYHVRHTAVPAPGNAEQLRNLAGRVLGGRLDLSKPLWEMWLVEGLEEGRWALITKIHHCMVDGVAATDLMGELLDAHPEAVLTEAEPWTPERQPSTAEVLAGGVQQTVLHPLRQAAAVPRPARLAAAPGQLRQIGSAARTGLSGLTRQLRTPVARTLNGPIGPHRRWAWADTRLDRIKQVRTGLGGTVNDVVLAAITRGFRDLLEERGELRKPLAVRSMVPVSVRRQDERGSLDNQVSAVYVDLPVDEGDPVGRLQDIREQMDAHKRVMQAVDARSIIAMGDVVAPTLLALGTRAAVRTGQTWTQAVTTNIPGPREPLYLLGRQLRSWYPYVPINSGTRISIGIFSYLGAMTFGINADFDAFPDLDVLVTGICRGMDELLAAAGAPADGDAVLVGGHT